MSHDCIWAPKGIPSGVNVKIPYKGYEISIACDDSCGAMKDWGRTEIRVFANEPGKDTFGMDVSNRFFMEGESMIYGYAVNLLHIFKIIDSSEELKEILVSENKDREA